LSLLPTEPVSLEAPKTPLFSRYQYVPWLAKTHSVSVLPAVTSLKALREVSTPAAAESTFKGFADPWFNKQQAASSAGTALDSRLATIQVRLRAAPTTRSADSMTISDLSPLPDTADEVRRIAVSLGADPSQDVFTGLGASETLIKEMDLSTTRILVFATHGLVSGDLDGLNQPALAFSSPDIVGGDDDGLLTMGEILGLRLNTDWVVLSACNTAAGDGVGAESVSGLGRAFFYAGTKALLVSNWPVETASTTALTTTLFQLQVDDPSLSRAESLRQAMLTLIDGNGRVIDGETQYSYAHPLFWAPFTIIGEGGRSGATGS
jgi:CHAT domain-containing protein